jgi:hypothetical protein
MTPMPGSTHASPLRFVYLKAMARFSLPVEPMRWVGISVGLAVAPGCLVLGDPQIDEPVRSQPQLIEVSPSTNEMFRHGPDETGTFDFVRFNAQLRSEDAGQPVIVVLLINYGQAANDGVQPWQARGGVTLEQPSTADVLRPISLAWKPAQIDPGTVDCRRVTMVASHSFFGKSPYEYCPTEENDVATLNWFVGLCGTANECSFDKCAEPANTECPAPGEVQQKFDETNGGGT